MEEDVHKNSDTSFMPKNWKSAYAVIVLSFGCVLQGFSIGFFVPGFRCLLHGTTKDYYGNPFKLSLDDAAWITGILNFGAAIGYLSAVMITDSIGRKRVVLGNTLLYLIGYLTTFLAHEAHQLMVGRFFAGLAVGGTSAVTIIYIYEISKDKLHGALGLAIQILVVIGILLAVTIGSCVEWDQLALVFIVLLIPYVIGLCITPESPLWLLDKGREWSVSENLEWFEGRMSSNITDQKIEALREKVKHERSIRNPSLSVLRPHWRQLAICLVLILTFHLSGFNVLIYYSVIIFDLAVTDIEPNVATVVSLICLLASYFIVVCYTFRFRRKPVLLSSMVGMAVCQFTLGVYFSSISDKEWFTERFADTLNHATEQGNDGKHQEHNYQEETGHGYAWVSVVATCLGLFLGNTGWLSVTCYAVAEILPENTHNIANKVVATFAYLTACVSTKTFADLVEGMKPHGAFFLYGCICLLGAIFTCVCLPETKGKAPRQHSSVQNEPRELQQYSSVPVNQEA